MVAGRDRAIRKWNRLVVQSREHACRRIERMHRRWQDEQAAIWAIARADGGEAMGLIGWGDINLSDGDAEIATHPACHGTDTSGRGRCACGAGGSTGRCLSRRG